MINNFVIEGNLGKDPETRKLENDKQVTSFTLANTTYYGGKENTSWFNVSVWNKLSEVAEKYLNKGSRVTVIGRMTQRSYENKEGKEVTVYELIGDQLSLPPKGENKEFWKDKKAETDELPF